MLPPPKEGSFNAAPGEPPKADGAQAAFAMGAAQAGGMPMPGGPPKMPGAGGMLPPGGPPEMFPAGEFEFDISKMPPADVVPTPPRPGGIHKFYAGGSYDSYLYLPIVRKEK